MNRSCRDRWNPADAAAFPAGATETAAAGL